MDIYTKEEFDLFKFELHSKFRSGIRTPINVLYIFMTLLGVGWASWVIPVLNKASVTPETIGIYVIGFLITVGLDALLIFKKTDSANKMEEAISVSIMIACAILIVISSFLSLKSFPENSVESEGSWSCVSYILLPIFLVVAIIMSVVLTGFDTDKLPVTALDRSLKEISDRQ